MRAALGPGRSFISGCDRTLRLSLSPSLSPSLSLSLALSLTSTPTRCALQRAILMHGRVFVSHEHVCFSSNVFGVRPS